jgi:hypothetical protein
MSRTVIVTLNSINLQIFYWARIHSEIRTELFKYFQESIFPGKHCAKNLLLLNTNCNTADIRYNGPSYNGHLCTILNS